jgi:hypothetical protein
MDARLDRVDERFDRMDARFDRVDERLSTMKSDSRNISSNIADDDRRA